MSDKKRTIHITDDRGLTARCGLSLATVDKPLWTVPENAPGWTESDAPGAVNPCDGCWRTIPKAEA